MDDKLFSQGVRLALELGIRLKVEIEGVDIPLESTFCGFVNNQLIITPPSPYHHVQHKLYDGADLVVRYFYNGTIYAFQTRIYAHIEKPVKLIFIEYPKLIQTSELRSEKRSCCFLETVIVVGEEENKGTIVDIAKSGCHCLVRGRDNTRVIPFKIDDQVKLQCRFPGVKTPLEIIGTVRNLRKSRYEANVGLQFHENTADVTMKIIIWYISTIEKFVSANEVKLDIP